MDFHSFALRIHARYAQMEKETLFVAGDGSVDVFATYLAAFPEGSNPMYLTRTEHDCSCCKQWVRHIGRLVSVKDGKVSSVWTADGLESPYKEVAASMDELIKGLPVTSLWRTKERQYGNETTRQMLAGKLITWNHFCTKNTGQHYSATPEAAKGVFNSTAMVLRRGLEELTPDAVEQVIGLIEGNALYRGEEHLPAVKQFAKVQREYFKKPRTEREKTLFVFERAEDPAGRFRNTVIGTLVQALSEGKDLERAVASFEEKVAPTNYKRTSALITPRMVQDAMKTIHELGLEPALERRLAHLSDVSVRNVLWVDRSLQGKLKGGVESLLMEAAAPTKPSDDAKPTEMSIESFMKSVLPTATHMDLYLRNQHTRNFVTLTAPVNPDPIGAKLFKWDNDFAWSYDGNVTDTITERVKAAGGNVQAKLRFSLAWYNYDDLDFHVKTPDGNHVYFGNKAGILDVDMNAGSGRSRQPVENLSFTRPKEGVYEVWVNQFTKRETADVGFSVEIASDAGVVQLSYKAAMPDRQNVAVGKFFVNKEGSIVKAEYGKGLVGEGIGQDKWGVKTEGMLKVQTVMFSPNYWDDNAIGNKHWFFFLEGCKVDGPARGIYNEFLRSGLEKHRKVFEVLGDKTKCSVTTEQLSGVGFSSTRGDKVTVAVKSDRSSRLYNINF